MGNDLDWKAFVFPPLIVGATVFIKNVAGDKQLPNNPMVLIDVVANMVEFIASKLVVELALDKNFEKATFLKMGFDITVEPLLHGLMNGAVKKFTIHAPSITNIKRITSIHHLPKPETHNFRDGFMDGVMYNILGNYFAGPLEWAV